MMMTRMRITMVNVMTMAVTMAAVTYKFTTLLDITCIIMGGESAH